MDNKEQIYQTKIESLSRNLIKVIKTFIIFPAILIMLTPMGYLLSLLTSIITITIYNQIIKKYVGKR